MARQSRIVSRKIFVVAIYEQMVQQHATWSQWWYTFALFQDKSQALWHMRYIAERFFTNGEKTLDEIVELLDVPYLTALILWWNEYCQRVIELINRYSTTFGFEQMDIMDRAIILAGGVECLVHHTPPKIMINEMIEIAKRYGDESSPKLINGIGHNVVQELSQ